MAHFMIPDRNPRIWGVWVRDHEMRLVIMTESAPEPETRSPAIGAEAIPVCVFNPRGWARSCQGHRGPASALGGPRSEGRALAGQLLIGVPLLTPRVGGVVVAALFPESPAVPGQVLHCAHPPPALPRVAGGNHDAQRLPALRGELGTVAMGGEQGVVGGEVSDREVGAVAEVG